MPKSLNRYANQQQPPAGQRISFGLTPILEDLAELQLSSNVKKSRDDFGILNRSNAKDRLLLEEEKEEDEVRGDDEQVVKQLKMLFDEDDTKIPENQLLQGGKDGDATAA